MKKLFNAIIQLLLVNLLFAAPEERLIKIVIAPDHTDWTYKVDENVKFQIAVMKNSHLLSNVNVYLEIGPDKMAPRNTKTLQLEKGQITVDGGTMKVPGFLRCKVTVSYEGEKYEGVATAAFDSQKIKPETTMPDDFVQFWDTARSESKKIPLDPQIMLLPDKCTNLVNVYHVGIQNSRINQRVYGILCIPKANGKYPAVLEVPGAGVREYTGDIELAASGVITFQIGIHGIPVNLDPEIYKGLASSSLMRYWSFNLDNKDEYYYKRVILGCLKSLDFITALPEYDGKNLAVTGGSQGGALSIMTAGLDRRIKCLYSFYPALCDHLGYLNGKAGGWPHMFINPKSATKERIETSRYYDTVNFAKLIKVPGYYLFGYNDTTCPPTACCAAFNSISAPKTIVASEETAHWLYPEQSQKAKNWILKELSK